MQDSTAGVAENVAEVDAKDDAEDICRTRATDIGGAYGSWFLLTRVCIASVVVGAVVGKNVQGGVCIYIIASNIAIQS